MNLKLRSETLYEVETNNGVVSFDTTDIDFPERIEKAFELFNNALEEFVKEEEVTDEEALVKIKKYVDDNYKGIDLIFGEGASDKIFSHNGVKVRSVSTLEQFFEQLPKILEDAGVKQQEYMQKRLSPENREKYKPKDHLQKRKKL